jgi:hypothetical protein
MNTPRPLLAVFSLAFAGLLAASQPMLAAAPKADARAAELVAALQAVSPDPLGGRLGLAVTPSNAADKSAAKTQTTQMTADQRAYASWKAATKS